MRKFIFDDMGTGKTRRSLETLLPEGTPHLIVVCPNETVAKTAWLKEAKNQGVENVFAFLSSTTDKDGVVEWMLGCEKKFVMVTTYGMCDKLREEIHSQRKLGQKFVFDLIVDESHYVKNVRSGRYRDVLGFARNATSALLLTGTPTPATLEDLYAQATILYPNKAERVEHYGLGFQSLGLFRSSFGTYRMIYVNGMSVKKWKYSGEMAQKCADILSVDIMDIRKTSIEEPVPIWLRASKDGDEIEAARQWEETGELDDDTYATNASSKAMKRSQIDDGFAYHTEGDGATWFGQSKIHVAMEYAADCIRRDEPLLVWIRYKEVGEYIRKHWNMMCDVNDFLEDPETRLEEGYRIVLANPQSAGTGIDGLQSLMREQLWIDLPWTAAEYHQANARLVRRGQLGEPVIHVIDTEWNRKVMDVIDGRAKLDEIVKSGYEARALDTKAEFDEMWKEPERPQDYVEPTF